MASGNKRLLFISFIVPAIVLLLSFACTKIFGKSCTLEYRCMTSGSVTVYYDKTILECTGQHIEGDVFVCDFRSVSSGDTTVRGSMKTARSRS